MGLLGGIIGGVASIGAGIASAVLLDGKPQKGMNGF